MERQVFSLDDGHGREGVTPFPHRWCSWGNPEHLPESAGFSLYGPRRKTLSKGEYTHPKKEKQKLFKGRMNFWFQIKNVMATRWQQRQEYWNGQ